MSVARYLLRMWGDPNRHGHTREKHKGPDPKLMRSKGQDRARTLKANWKSSTLAYPPLAPEAIEAT